MADANHVTSIFQLHLVTWIRYPGPRRRGEGRGRGSVLIRIAMIFLTIFFNEIVVLDLGHINNSP